MKKTIERSVANSYKDKILLSPYNALNFLKYGSLNKLFYPGIIVVSNLRMKELHLLEIKYCVQFCDSERVLELFRRLGISSFYLLSWYHNTFYMKPPIFKKT